MAYKIHFMGLVCLVEQSDGTFLAALADGSTPTDPTVARHIPYVVCITRQWESVNWKPEFERDGSSFFRIDPGATLDFHLATTTGPIEATQYMANTYRWSQLDPNFLIINRAHPKGTIATASLKRGTYHLSRQRSDALVAHVTIADSQSPSVTLRNDEVERTITFDGDREVVVANVSVDFIRGTSSDHPDDFFIYYVMNEGSEPPSGNTPQPNNSIRETNDHDGVHPLLRPMQGLDVSCSPIHYR